MNSIPYRITSIRSKSLLFLVIFLLPGSLLVSCTDNSTNLDSNRLNKIMPLGASRVEGARPVFESYRYELWKLLVDGGWEFDFIGTKKDDFPYEDYAELSFDNDHEGRSGFTSVQILAEIEEWIEIAGAPDIVLFSSPGGNDILGESATYSEILSNINNIIDIIQESNPNVTIVIEKLAPGKTIFMTEELQEAFDRMQEDVVTISEIQTTNTSKVITVDMATGFDDSHLADVIHYNEKGALFIAERYYDILVDILVELE